LIGYKLLAAEVVKGDEFACNDIPVYVTAVLIRMTSAMRYVYPVVDI